MMSECDVCDAWIVMPNFYPQGGGLGQAAFTKVLRQGEGYERVPAVRLMRRLASTRSKRYIHHRDALLGDDMALTVHMKTPCS